MSPAELFDAELLDPLVPAPSCLPARVAPLADEALASWLFRFAEPFGVAPEALLLGDGVADLASHPDWWRRPDPLLVAAIARGTGMTADIVRSLSFADWRGGDRDDVLPDRFGRQRFTAERPSHQTRRIAVCPECLSEDETPYVRRQWALSWTAACTVHGVQLLRSCPDCGAKLRMPSLASKDRFAPDRCPRCSYRLSGVSATMAPEPVRRFQRRLFDGRPSGIVELPDIGPLAWPVAVALFDVLLGAVWIDTKARARSQLFARIDRDLGGRPLGEAADGYTGLVILGWIFEAWPIRVQAALAILRAVRPRRQMQRWPSLDPAVRDQVEKLLLGAWPDERHSPERGWWRAWIDDLPETGDELRAEAARQRLPHRRARLLAIADVRDGMPVEAAAEVADVLPRTLYCWLKRGAEGGLEAALERPTGQLAEPQVNEVAGWIAEASPDGPRWRADRVQGEVRRRFGLEISLDVASRLLRHHGPWRRRKILAKRRLTIAPVYD